MYSQLFLSHLTILILAIYLITCAPKVTTWWCCYAELTQLFSLLVVVQVQMSMRSISSRGKV